MSKRTPLEVIPIGREHTVIANGTFFLSPNDYRNDDHRKWWVTVEILSNGAARVKVELEDE